jgi:hypothetical protein
MAATPTGADELSRLKARVDQKEQELTDTNSRIEALLLLETLTPQQERELQFRRLERQGLQQRLVGLQQEINLLQQAKVQLLKNAGESLACIVGRGGWHSN